MLLKSGHIYYAHAQAEMREVDSDTNMMVVHSIAKSVFNQQEERIHACKAEDKPARVDWPKSHKGFVKWL